LTPTIQAKALTHQSQARATEVVALALGDVYQRAVLGIAEAGDDKTFARQIEVAAAAYRFGRAT
jgi:TetR/AcrR family transcriptional repressor of mexJK operon